MNFNKAESLGKVSNFNSKDKAKRRRRNRDAIRAMQNRLDRKEEAEQFLLTQDRLRLHNLGRYDTLKIRQDEKIADLELKSTRQTQKIAEHAGQLAEKDAEIEKLKKLLAEKTKEAQVYGERARIAEKRMQAEEKRRKKSIDAELNSIFKQKVGCEVCNKMKI